MVNSNTTYTNQARQLVILNWNLPVGIDLDAPLIPHLPAKAVTQAAYVEVGLNTIGQLLWYVQQGEAIMSSGSNVGPKTTRAALYSILGEYQLKD